MSQKKAHLLSILQGQPVIPVLLIERVDDAVPITQALLRGGIKAVEITLRTLAALDCIKAIANKMPEVTVGAGTVLDNTQFEAAEKAGAQFIVSPGLNSQLIEKAASSDIPLLPGAITPSEIMTAREKGYDILKFFPAEQAGGTVYLQALVSPFAGVMFCPTGGISLPTAAQWLTLPNVICVGGSWLAPKKLVERQDWDAITALATQASQLHGH
ncbi:MAG: 2-dehydro-3-deoxyphosphogluconate aldolase / (4S)-4-hydroxy-2-oxoglutarate aldolase [Candidatus Tokpelaia sp. JSC189]|nr:MAG: 2-dehydro-3-deoxyphosphogluconate aldolase / (4S)-4-hydroxy-2-oxoglutarate aldolase [Candidatus Tokpelaia sp. JSC189]